MFERKQLSISPKTRAAVLRILRGRGDGRTVERLAEEAYLAWVEKVARDDAPAAQAGSRGYQWKSLFLPEGTQVRFAYKHETYYADVRGDKLMYMGRSYSPRRLLLHVTGTVRNAWRELWLRGPDDFRWHLADTRRHILRRTPRGLHRRGVDVASHLDMEVVHGASATPAMSTVIGAHVAPSADASDNASVDASTGSNAAARAGSAAGASHKPPVPGGQPVNGPVYRYPTVVHAARLRAILYRDDLVRDDQPDLSAVNCTATGHGAGRTGPRDRRWANHHLRSLDRLAPVNEVRGP